MAFLPRFKDIVLDPSVALNSPLQVASPDCATLYSTPAAVAGPSFIPADAEIENHQLYLWTLTDVVDVIRWQEDGRRLSTFMFQSNGCNGPCRIRLI